VLLADAPGRRNHQAPTHPRITSPSRADLTHFWREASSRERTTHATPASTSGLETPLASRAEPNAIVVRDDGEAPLRLQQDQVLDLRRDTAIYSECVHYCPFPGALLPWQFKQG